VNISGPLDLYANRWLPWMKGDDPLSGSEEEMTECFSILMLLKFSMSL
jgi:hypothetical protein